MSGNSHENNIRTLLVKFTKVKPSGLETDARWKDLVQLYKVCNTEEDSRDMNLLNSPECEDVRKAIGLTFFAHFVTKRVRKIDQRMVENIFQFLRNHVSVQSSIRRDWINYLKRKLDVWSGRSILSATTEVSKDVVLIAIVNWNYVFMLCGLEVTTSSSTLRIYLSLAEKLLAQRYGLDLCMKAMDVWTDFAWEIRAKYSEKKYRELVLQPTSISTDDVTFYMKRIYLLWTIGRGFADQNMLENEHYGTSVGQAFKLCLNPDGEFRQPPMAYQAAAEMFCHLCVPAVDIPFRSDNIKSLVTPLTSEQFTKIAPSVTNELIQFLLNCENQSSDKLSPTTIIHVLGCFLAAISKCSVECLPSLSRLTEFLAQQSSSKQSTTIIREILTRIPPRLLQQRFQSDDSREGQTSVARRLLKLILLGNGNYYEEAKKLITIILGSDDHLAALDQVTHTLTDDAVRPGRNSVQILKLWNMSGDLFSQKISQGHEVSNDPHRSDLSSIYRFFSIPILLNNFTSDISESTLKKFKQEWRNLYSVVKSNASLLVDFNYDDLVSSLASDLLKNGLDNIGPALTLELLNLVLCNKGDTSPSFFDSQEALRDADLAKHHKICTNILKAVIAHPTFKDFKSETVEAGLAIISQLLSDGQVEAFKDFSQIMPIFAKSALENRKNPSWQFSLDLVTQIFELIEKSSSAPVELFGHVEDFFILMLSDVSSRRMRYVCAQTWEAKFRQSDEKLALTDEFWKLIESFYTEGKWPIPRSKDPKSADQDRSITTPLREKNSATKSSRKNATPQRYNRQLAALSGRTPTRGTPTSRKKIMASTFQNKDDDTGDFVTIDSPISFSGRRLTENQKEKMREKKGEEHVGTALYSHVDDSQSSRNMSQFLGSDTQSTTGHPVVNSTAISRDENRPDFMEPDESAVDATSFSMNESSFQPPTHQSTVNMTAGAGCNPLFDDTNDTVEESYQTATESIVTPTDTTVNKTAGFGCQSSFNETTLNGTHNLTDATVDDSANATVDMTGGVAIGTSMNSTDATMDATGKSLDATGESLDATGMSLDATDVSVNATMDMTNGVAIGTSFGDCTKTVYEITDDSISFNQPSDPKAEKTGYEDESMLLKTTKEKSDSKVLATEDESALLRSTVNDTDNAKDIHLTGASGKFQIVSDSTVNSQEELSSREEATSQESDDVVFVEDSKEKVSEDEERSQMDDNDSLTSGSLSPDRPVICIDLTDATPMPPKKTPVIDLSETTQLPMPEPAVLSASKPADADLNTSTSSLPVLSDNEEDLDEDEESIHEPFAQSFKVLNGTTADLARRLDFSTASATQEFETTQDQPIETTSQSPSILKRKRSLDVGLSENKQRRVSFSDQFAEGSSKSVSKIFSRGRQRSSRLTLGTTSPATRTMSRSERMLQMANGNLDGSVRQAADHKVESKAEKGRSAVQDAIVAHQEHLSLPDRLFLINLLSNYE